MPYSINRAVLEREVVIETYRSGDEYDREAITHVMACTSHDPGELLRPNWVEAKPAAQLK